MKSIVVILFSICLFLTSCQIGQDADGIVETMREVNGVHERLYSYVWGKDQFENPANKKEILNLLSDLHAHFHKLESSKTLAIKDPGFTITLSVQNSLLQEAQTRFEAGDYSYAKFKLKGMTENCMTCHSRFEVKKDFYGSMPLPVGTDFEDRLRVGEFLIATRQFDRAEDYLFTLAQEMSEVASGYKLALDAVRLWLLVEVRVKENFHGSASSLSALIDRPCFQGEVRDILSRWVVDLKALESNKSETLGDTRTVLNKVGKLLSSNLLERKLIEDNYDFVKTARSSALLHSLLIRDLSGDERREALTALAIVYSRMPIDFLKHLAPMYAELVIRQYPHSAESRTVFSLYKEQFEFESTGSGGEHLSEDDRLKFEDLEKLAR